MNQNDFEKWKFEVLLELLQAIAEDKYLKKNLVLKGAIILNRYLSNSRKSLDIDTNLSRNFVDVNPNRERQKSILREQLELAISRHFEGQDPVRYELLNFRIEFNPKIVHPRGWGGFRITISVKDNNYASVRGLPILTIDVAAPEPLSKDSLTEISIGRSKIQVYSLERIAGEKARAYLSSLPTYRNKVSASDRTPRVRDLYDLANILRHKRISDRAFWDTAGQEFRLTCESRYVDCPGIDCFFEDWTRIEGLYSRTPIIPTDILFKEVEKSILAISRFWKRRGVIPFLFPL